MANEHAIFLHGKRLDPKDAVRLQLPFPSDTLLVCPACQGHAVGSVEAKLVTRLPEETGDAWIKLAVPRMQDRWCHDCGHRWATVLPPERTARIAPYLGG